MKYKYSGAGWVKKIDGSSITEFNPSQAERYAGHIKEMMDWVAEGNEIEPQFTAEELAEKETEEAKQSLENQEKELLNLISSNEYHLISRRFVDDIPVWEAKLDEWADQLEEVIAGKLVEIAEKPFT